MAWSRIYFVVFCLIANVSFAQVNGYMVFFRDKAGTSFSLNAPQAYLSQRAIDRRVRQGIAVTEQDFPVNGSYVSAVKDLGIDAFHTSRWMNGVLVQCENSMVAQIEGLSFVDHVELVAPNAKLVSQGRKKNSHRTKSSETNGKTQAQLQQIGLDDMQTAGYKGETIHIAVFDSGFPGVNITQPFQHIWAENRINLDVSKDFVYNTDDVFQYDEHGTEVFSVIAAYQEADFIGGSYEAEYQLYVTEDVPSEYRIEEYNWLFAAERADSAGVDVVNSSLGYYDFDDSGMNYSKSAMDGQTTVITKAAQGLADRGVVVVCSAGNEGNVAWQIVTAPADARDVLAIGSVNSSGIRAGSSSMGPSADGRIKPDVAAMGVNTSVIRPDGTSGTASGTSLASPLVTSLVAGVWQRYPYLTAKEVMDVIRKSASQAASPDNLLGYGIPNFKGVVNYIEQHPQEEIFEVYPNPVVADTFTIRPFDPVQITACRVELISSQGQMVFRSEASFSWLDRTYTANVEDLSAGLYFLRLWWNDKRYIFRMVKYN